LETRGGNQQWLQQDKRVVPVDGSENSLRSLDYIKVIDGSRQAARDILDEPCSNGIDTAVSGKRGNSVQPAGVRLALARNEFI
jgi:hypothetical protein